MLPFVRITTSLDKNIGLTDSKFGGVPFVANTQSYPYSTKGNPLTLLAQINFAQVHQQLQQANCAESFEPLPKQGLLQIFIDASDDLYGLDFDNPYPNNDGYQVRYITDLSCEPLVNLEALTKQSLDDEEMFSPIFTPCKLTFNVDYGSVDGHANDVLEYNKALKELAYKDEELEDEADKYMDVMGTVSHSQGHKLLGMPFFTQYEPRDENSEQVLLLQIDTDSKEREDIIMWGDSGVGNFFITPAQLHALEFDKLMYNWDCC